MATFPRTPKGAGGAKKLQRKLEQQAQNPRAELSDAIPRHQTVMTLIKRDGCRCYLCQKPMNAADLHIDHIIPRIRGGTDHHYNLALACQPCNSRKSAHYISFTIKDRMLCHWLSSDNSWHNPHRPTP